MNYWLTNIINKLNPAQSTILLDEGTETHTSISDYTVTKAYSDIEVVQRGSNLIVDSAAGVKFDVKDKVKGVAVYDGRVSAAKLDLLLNYKPNPYQNADSFLRNIYLDLVVEGNAFIYYDRMYLYHLPAANVNIVGDKRTYIKRYEYGETDFSPNEIIHIKENSVASIYRGDSRLLSALPTINTLRSMLDFQTNFFSNNAIPGMVLKTANILSEKIKERTLLRWMQEYNPKKGGKKPMILDGDFQIESLGHTDFRELDFSNSVDIHEDKILKALGVPSILLDSGNNANITPNMRMFYINTVMPLVDKVCGAFEYFFGFDLKPNKTDVLALRPEMRDESAFYTALTNAGIMTRNEAREALRLEKSDDATADDLIVPANVAGSAVNPNIGGKPPKDNKKD